MSHRFKPGQSVRFGRGFPYRNAAEGSNKVTRQLPYNNGDYQYCIKSASEPHERVVTESELDAA